jgi:hypothetical protein
MRHLRRKYSAISRVWRHFTPEFGAVLLPSLAQHPNSQPSEAVTLILE